MSILFRRLSSQHSSGVTIRSASDDSLPLFIGYENDVLSKDKTGERATDLGSGVDGFEAAAEVAAAGGAGCWVSCQVYLQSSGCL